MWALRHLKYDASLPFSPVYLNRKYANFNDETINIIGLKRKIKVKGGPE